MRWLRDFSPNDDRRPGLTLTQAELPRAGYESCESLRLRANCTLDLDGTRHRNQRHSCRRKPHRHRHYALFGSRYDYNHTDWYHGNVGKYRLRVIDHCVVLKITEIDPGWKGGGPSGGIEGRRGADIFCAYL